MILSASGLDFAWPSGARALTGIDLNVPAGGRVAIIGGNGSGKSTLAGCLAGVIHADGVMLEGRPLAGLTAAERAAAVQIVGQRPDLHLSGRAATLRSEIAFGLENLALPRDLILSRVDHAIQVMGLSHLAARDPRRLSGGETQRLVIASALAMRPRLLILDEPVTDLDHDAREGLTGRLSQLAPDLAVVVLDVAPDPWRAQGFDLRALQGGRLGVFKADPPLTCPEPASREGDNLVQIRDLHFGHDPARPLFSGLDLDIPGGVAVAVTGPNGAGKSTLMRLIAGLERPKAGAIRIAGLKVGKAHPRVLARVLGKVFQNADRQFAASTVLEDVALAARLQRLPDPLDRARNTLADLGLKDVAGQHPLDLHNGVRRLAAVAAAVAHGPRLLILDETQRGLDATHQARLGRMMKRFTATGGTVLFVCHDDGFVRRNATHRLGIGNGDMPRLRPV